MAKRYPVGIMPDHKRYINAYRLHLGASVLEWVLTGVFIFYPDVLRALDADHETNITWALIFSVVLMGSIITAPAAALPTITETLEDLT